MGDAYRDDHEAALMQIAALQRENAELRDRLQSSQTGRERAAGLASGEMNGTGAFVTGMLFFLGLVGSAAVAAHLIPVPTRAAIADWYPAPSEQPEGLVEITAAADPSTVVMLDGRQVYLEPGAPTLFSVEPERKHCVSAYPAGGRAQLQCAWVHAGETRTMDFVHVPAFKSFDP